jgi:hypothetical protein
MSYHPINLAFRFFLELSALASLAKWGLTNFDGYTRYAMAVFMPLLFMIIWGVFAVKGDKSRSGKTIVSTPGYIRFPLELAWFGFSIWALFDAGHNTLPKIFLAGVVLHYLLSMGRIRWLLKGEQDAGSGR